MKYYKKPVTNTVSKPRKFETIFHARQDAPEGTIGFLFDYYRKHGNKVPDNVFINGNNFKSIR